jgi:hypothetical protein
MGPPERVDLISSQSSPRRSTRSAAVAGGSQDSQQGASPLATNSAADKKKRKAAAAAAAEKAKRAKAPRGGGGGSGGGGGGDTGSPAAETRSAGANAITFLVSVQGCDASGKIIKDYKKTFSYDAKSDGYAGIAAATSLKGLAKALQGPISTSVGRCRLTVSNPC